MPLMNTDKDPLNHIPALGVCGWSGSGKTTLILALTAHFLARGLRVGVIKHDVHGLSLDREGKDSYRFFEAGADVIMRSSKELFVRAHRVGEVDLGSVLREVAPFYDLILVEGHKATPLIDKLWVLAEGEEDVPPEVSNVMAVLPRAVAGVDDRLARSIGLVEAWLSGLWRKAPVWGAILLGDNRSESVNDRRKELARLGAALGAVTADMVVIGNTEMSLPLIFAGQIPAIPDRLGWHGPLLAAMRWAPFASWLFVSEGMDASGLETAGKFLSAREPGAWLIGSIGSFQTGQRLQSLYCDYRVRPLLEAEPECGDVGRWSVTRQV
jgi:molybdopterin-guanine dinucleotide biosynthesis protein MobB